MTTREHLGTLNVGSKGDSCFYGATARGEASAILPRLARLLNLTRSVDLASFTDTPHVQFLLKTRHQKRDASYFRHTRLSDRVLSVPFPEAPPELIASDTRQVVYSHLPPYEDARGACELFLNYSSYMYVVLVLFNISSILTD